MSGGHIDGSIASSIDQPDRYEDSASSPDGDDHALHQEMLDDAARLAPSASRTAASFAEPAARQQHVGDIGCRNQKQQGNGGQEHGSRPRQVASGCGLHASFDRSGCASCSVPRRDAIGCAASGLTGLRLAEAKSRREPAEDDKGALGWISHQTRFSRCRLESGEHGNRRPYVDLLEYLDAAKVWRSNSNHRELTAVDCEWLADRTGIGVQMRRPECVTDDHNGVFAWLGLLIPVKPRPADDAPSRSK